VPTNSTALDIGAVEVTTPPPSKPESSHYFGAGVKMATAKQAVRSLLDQIPDDPTFEDIQYHL
jgi:hypothetical protein